MKKYIIGRPINGITINGLEYAIDSNKNPIKFDCEQDARQFILDAGYTLKDLEDGNIIIEEYEDGNANELQNMYMMLIRYGSIVEDENFDTDDGCHRILVISCNGCLFYVHLHNGDIIKCCQIKAE